MNSKKIIVGIILLVTFFIVLFIIFMPVVRQRQKWSAVFRRFLQFPGQKLQ